MVPPALVPRVASRAPAATPAGASALRIARFPPTTDENPYQHLLYRHLAALGFELVHDAVFALGWLWRARREVRFLHFHWRLDRYYAWPDDYECRRPPARLRRPLAWLKLGGFLIRLAAARALGYRLIWTIHEVYPHETISRRLDRVAALALARLSHVLVAHDRPTAQRAEAELGVPAAEIEVVPHGSYTGVYPPGRSRAAVRVELGIPPEAFAFLCFGNLRPYKEIELLLAAFALVERRDTALVIAGAVSNTVAGRAVLLAAASDRRIRPLLGYVPDERVEELFGACDAAVLPRGDGGTSGSLILALSLGLPVIAAERPAYIELIGAEEAGWLFRPGEVDSLRASLERAASSAALARAKGAAALQRAERLRWPETAELTAAAMLGPGRA